MPYHMPLCVSLRFRAYATVYVLTYGTTCVCWTLGVNVSDQDLNRVISVATGKGGSFKTSLTANAAGICAQAGSRVLVLDMDPQGDLQDDLGYFDDPRLDEGQQLLTALASGQPLQAVLTGVRENLDVIPGGALLADLEAMLQSRIQRGGSADAALAHSLAPLAKHYDLVFIDTPPTNETLQLLALNASRWLLVPTKSDTSSIRAISRIAQIAGVARKGGHQVDVLGVVLAGVNTAAKRVLAEASGDINALLGGEAPLFEGTIRHSEASAVQARQRGVLAHELAELVEGAEPFWKDIKSGSPRLSGAAPALAGDYIGVVEQMIGRIKESEQMEQSA